MAQTLSHGRPKRRSSGAVVGTKRHAAALVVPVRSTLNEKAI
jgi:hypothetical protein